MEIKDDCDASTDDFWYDLSEGYLKPSEILVSGVDVKRVADAIRTIRDFENSCFNQIEGFFR